MKSVLLVALLARCAVAGPIIIAEWYEFGFDPNHSPTVSGCLPADPTGVQCRPGTTPLRFDTPPWTFASVGPLSLQITDAFAAGDSFTVFDSGAMIGSTPSVPALGGTCGLNPDVCFTNPAFSHATFRLPPGAHSITVTVQAVQLQGEGFIRVLALPEPSLTIVCGLGLLLFGCLHKIGA